MVVQWQVLSPHRPCFESLLGPSCVAFACSPHAYVARLGSDNPSGVTTVNQIFTPDALLVGTLYFIKAGDRLRSKVKIQYNGDLF